MSENGAEPAQPSRSRLADQDAEKVRADLGSLARRSHSRRHIPGATVIEATERLYEGTADPDNAKSFPLIPREGTKMSSGVDREAKEAADVLHQLNIKKLQEEVGK